MCAGVTLYILLSGAPSFWLLHKDKGQALMEFHTADDASAALSFHGSTIFGSAVKIKHPKDFVKVTVS
ncbi:hypothetical protein QN277_003799 [Acacia crassicarpa]|uniref:RRM domain-containing protein n=1 Tax=Acacia crassicarpa TaxID=499986 RepID=A0AAE1K037_9FABA|nr:hypothetical protein QN277_003799 [Acacia crassicarpa]